VNGPTEPPKEGPRQLELVPPMIPLDALIETDTLDDADEVTDDQAEYIPADDNVIVLPGFGPLQPEPWGPFEDEEPPFESEAESSTEALVPPTPEMFQSVLEALLFSAEGPLSEAQLRNILCHPPLQDLQEALYRTQDKFKRFNSGIRLVEVAKGWQLRTEVRCARWVAKLRGEKPLRLSKAALETLSIVAFRQPVSRAEIEDLRGVDPGGVLRMLCERGLTTITGRKDIPGRPLLYGTTNDFLGMFGLRDLSDLPTLRDLRELQQDDPREGIGGTVVDYMSTLSEALGPIEKFDESEGEGEGEGEVEVELLTPPTIRELRPLDPLD
jgi:segregation and condensation protein B